MSTGAWSDAAPTGVPGLVRLPSGREVVGCAVRALAVLAPAPTLVVRLDGRDAERDPWPTLPIAWPDFRGPRDTPAAMRVLRTAHARAPEERVALACRGGRGRTGTALAMLAVLDGVPAPDAVDWVRAHYRSDAVETRGQRRWVLRAAPGVGPA